MSRGEHCERCSIIQTKSIKDIGESDCGELRLSPEPCNNAPEVLVDTTTPERIKGIGINPLPSKRRGIPTPMGLFAKIPLHAGGPGLPGITAAFGPEGPCDAAPQTPAGRPIRE